MCERRTLPMPGTERGWGGLLPPATAWGAFWCGTRGVSRQAGRQGFARSAIYSCALPRGSAAKLACQKKWIYIYKAQQATKARGKATGPRPELLTLGLACNTPRRRPWNLT